MLLRHTPREAKRDRERERERDERKEKDRERQRKRKREEFVPKTAKHVLSKPSKVFLPVRQ